jgi:hypothetical protein
VPTTFGDLIEAAGAELRKLQSHRLGNASEDGLWAVLPAFDDLLRQLERLSTVGREWERAHTDADRDWRATADSFTRRLSWARMSIGAAQFGRGGSQAPTQVAMCVHRAADLYGAAADLLTVGYREPALDNFLGPTGPPRHEITATLAAQLWPLARAVAEWSSVVRGSTSPGVAVSADGAYEAAIAVSNASEVVARTEARWGSPAPTLDGQEVREWRRGHAPSQAPAIDRAVAAADRLLSRAGAATVSWSLDVHTPSVLAGQSVAFSIVMDVSARLLEALNPALTDGRGDVRAGRLKGAADAARTSQAAWADVRRAWQGVRTPWEAPATAAVRNDACELAGQMGRAVFAAPNWRLPPGPGDRLRNVAEFRDDEALASLLHGLQSVTVSIVSLAEAHRSIADRLAADGQLMVPTRRLCEERDEPWPYARPDRPTYMSLDMAYDVAGQATRRTAVAMTPLADVLATGGTRSWSLARMRVNDISMANLQRNDLRDRGCADRGLEIA